MRLSLKWLKQFADTKSSPEQIAEKFTMAGLEVEKIEYLDKGLEDVYVGEIKKIVKHQDADRLFIGQVDVGAKIIQVVFADKAVVKEGDKVPVAVAPANLNGREIKETKFRGSLSQGMLCLNSELRPELSDDIVYFTKDTQVGLPAAKELGLDDVVLHFDITPNRPDCLSVIGLARELAALEGKSINVWSKFRDSSILNLETKPCVQPESPNKPVFKMPNEAGQDITDLLEVEIKDFEDTMHYGARVIKNVKVGESPKWLKNYLLSAGIRSINNVVDTTNYVMTELGMPMHAFDFDKIISKSDKKKIIVRRSKKGELLTTLDGIGRELSDKDIIMEDDERIIDLMCVMGGENTKVDLKTKNVIIQSPICRPALIRKTSHRLNLRTEASGRFEKGIASELVEPSVDLGARLLADLAGGSICKGKILKSGKENKPEPILVKLSYVQRLLGHPFSFKEIKRILELLQFKVNEKSDKEFEATPPSFRLDIMLAADVAEEIGRIYNYNNLPPDEISGFIRPSKRDKFFQIQYDARASLLKYGFSETNNYSFYSKKAIQDAGFSSYNHIRVRNPLNEVQELLRQELLPALLIDAAQNLRDIDGINLFEIGTVFIPEKEGSLPNEKTMLGILSAEKKVGLYELYKNLKGVISALIKDLGLCDKLAYSVIKDGVEINAGGVFCGSVRVIKGGVLKKFKIKTPLVYGELNLSALQDIPKKKIVYNPLPKYPLIERDLSFEFPLQNSADFATIIQYFERLGPPVINAEFIDEYVIDNLKRSLTFRVIYGSNKRTLESKEAKDVEDKIIKDIKEQFNAVLRSRPKT